ncbi:MAG: divalent cation tolerance protein CutA [Patescibacteria group bacterium]
MTATYYEVKISAENQEQAETILNSLLEKKLVTGGQFIVAPARFLWKDEINDMKEYVTVTSYTTDKHKEAVIADVRKTSVEEVPMITFVTADDLNQELRNWINTTLD